ASARPVKVMLPGAAAASPAPPAAGATFESLACGFRFTAPGKRIRATPEDDAVDTIELAPVGDARIVARCAVRDRRAADPLGAIERQLAAARGGGPSVQRRRVGAADCLAVGGPQRRLICLGPDHVITLAVQSSDASLAGRVLDSLALFDRT